MKLKISICSLAIVLSLSPLLKLSASNSSNTSSTASISYTLCPANLQFFARDSQDSADVLFSGKLLTTGYDTMYIEVYRNNVLWKRKSTKLTYALGSANFSLGQKIHAELSEYKLKLFLKHGSQSTLVKSADSIICGDAFIICGQSNSHPTDPSATYSNEFCRSFGVQTPNFNGNTYNPADTLWGFSKANGSISYWSGPCNVGVWGLQLQKKLKESFGLPTCIINGGRGSSSIESNLRNNSNQTDLTTIYGKLLYRVNKSGLANGIKAIFWYQGESNGDNSWTSYTTNFQTLYNAWKQNYPNFKKIFLFQTRPCCSDQYASQLRNEQRKLAVKFSEIELLATAGASNYEGCHYTYTGYNAIADMVFRPMSKHFYTTTDTLDMRPPNIRAAYYNNTQKTQIAILFSNSKVSHWPADTLGQSMKNYFYLNGTIGNISSGTVSGDTVKLNLINSSTATRLTYLPTVWNHDDSMVYEGPFLRNSKKIGAISFYDYPISDNPPVTLNLISTFEGYYNIATNKLNIRDTATVIIRSNVYPYQIKDSSKAIIDSVTFTGTFTFYSLPAGTYYIVVKGKNCIETWSKSGGVVFSKGGTVTYNFTTAASQAYGNNQKLKGSKYCIYNSDVNQDGFIDARDNVQTFNDGLQYLTGYRITDINGDRVVDSYDLALVFNNLSQYVGKITP